MTGNLTDFNLNILNSTLNYQLIYNQIVEKTLIGVGFVILLIMIISYYKLERRNGYVRYFAFLGMSCGLTFLVVLSGETFDQIYQVFSLALTKIGFSSYLS